MKLSKGNQKAFVVRVVTRVLLPVMQDKMQKIAMGAVIGVADSPMADKIVDTLTQSYMEKAKSFGLVDDHGALDLSLAESALRGVFNVVETVAIEDFKEAPKLMHTLFKGVELEKSDVDVIMSIAHELADTPAKNHQNSKKIEENLYE